MRIILTLTIMLLLVPSQILCKTPERKTPPATPSLELQTNKDLDTAPTDEQKQKAMEWFKRGYEASMAKKYDEAIKCFKNAIGIIPNFASAYQNLGSVYIKKEQWDAAASMLKKAIEIEPTMAGAYFNLGIVYDSQNKIDEAITAYEKAIQISPNLSDAYLNLGVAYTKKGIDAMAADSFYHAGCIYLQEGNRDGALKALEGLKGTKAKELERDLFKKLYPESHQQQKDN